MQARPAPVPRAVYQLCPYGIEQDITEDGEQVVVVLNGKTLEAALPHMAVTPVMPMVAPDMTGHPPLHKRAEGLCSSGRNDEMEMVGHQAEAENLDGMPSFRRAEQIEASGIVAILVEDGGAAVATVQHMIGMASAVATGNAGHGCSRVRQMEGGEQEKVACPLFFHSFLPSNLYQCLQDGDSGLLAMRTPLLFGTYTVTTWGDHCYGLLGEGITMFHLVGQPNGPVFSPDPPVKFIEPGNAVTCSKAGDPCDTRTGLYIQADTDMEVPDVMPITLTRSYRTEDLASHAFGIGASHPYDQYMLRDDLCTEIHVILPDGASIAFLRTTGTNCLDSTLQHTTTQTAFYGATFAWDQSIQRYRLMFRDGTEWRFSDYGSLVAMLDRNGNTMTLTRAAAGGLAGNLTKITTPNGRYLTFTYDSSNRVTQVTDILGRTITYTYDANGIYGRWRIRCPA